MKTRRILIDSHHPKHYLTLRAFGEKCRENDIDVVWTARDKDVLLRLMREDGVTPHVLTTARSGLVRLAGELLAYDWKLMRLARQHKPLALFGKTISIAHVGRLLRIPSVIINDDDAAANPQYPRLGYPFAHRIITPDCLDEDYGPRHRKFPGLCELAYLHPDTFSPDPDIRRELGVDGDARIFLIRTVALRASHDVGQKGLSAELVSKVLEVLEERGRVFISSEAPLHRDFEKYRPPISASRMHHVLAAADLLIGDSQTMAAEAAVLGTPSLRLNSFVGRISYLENLENRFGLTFGFRPNQEVEFLAKLGDLLAMTNLRQEFERRRKAMLAVLRDPTDVFWDELCRCVPPN